MRLSAQITKVVDACKPGALKARAHLAWGEAPGECRINSGGLKARAKRLVPYEPLVKRHTVFGEQRAHLGLKISSLMVPRLIVDVPHQRLSITKPYRERRITALPPKSGEFRPFSLDPFRRCDFQFLYSPRHSCRSRKEERNVNMICDSTNANANVLRAIHYRRKVGVHLASYVLLQKRPSILGAEHQMHKNIRERLRHCSEYSAGLQPVSSQSVAHPVLNTPVVLGLPRSIS